MSAGSIYDTPWAGHSRRGWTTLASFGLQAVIVAILLTVPLVYTTGLPQTHWTNTFVLPYFTPKPTPTPNTTQGPTTGGDNINAIHPFTVPSEIPNGPPKSGDDPTAPAFPTDPSIGLRPGIPGPSMPFVGTANWIPTPVISHPILKPVISSIMESLLIHRVQPTYPQLALQSRTQGSVVLQAIIGRDGTIENLHALTGHPLLVPAAIHAVQQWRYRPYVLNGEPVEVETQVIVNFVLGG